MTCQFNAGSRNVLGAAGGEGWGKRSCWNDHTDTPYKHTSTPPAESQTQTVCTDRIGSSGTAWTGEGIERAGMGILVRFSDDRTLLSQAGKYAARLSLCACACAYVRTCVCLCL